MHEDLRDTEDRLRVLVAEDNDDLRGWIVELLETSFQVVAAVSTGRGLLDAAVALEPDVIVSDLMMPSLTGAEVLMTLRAAGSAIPFVLQTTVGGQAQAWLDMGATCVVDKFDLPLDLVTAVHSAAAGKIFVSRGLPKAP